MRHRDRNARGRRGFTLLELVLVLAVLIIVTAIAIPSLSGPIANQKLRKSADLVRAELARARNRAMRTGQVQVFRYQMGTGNYLIEPWLADDVFLEADLESRGGLVSGGPILTHSVNVTLPDGVTFGGAAVDVDVRAVETMERNVSAQPLGVGSPSILFYPDGTTSTARILLSNERPYFVIIQLRGLTGIAKVSDLMSGDEMAAAMNPADL